MEKKITPMRTAQGLFLLNMGIWLVIGGISIFQLRGEMESFVLAIVALMVLGNGILMGLAAWLLAKRTIWSYLFALALLAINVVTTFTDQVGLADYATVLVTIILFLLLILKRREFVTISPADGG